MLARGQSQTSRDRPSCQVSYQLVIIVQHIPQPIHRRTEPFKKPVAEVGEFPIEERFHII